ncbi:MAG: cytochrome c [Gammaproteobacteria bacterium]|nr:cytochrome c [Gammaproteobacteria bacterium]
MTGRRFTRLALAASMLAAWSAAGQAQQVRDDEAVARGKAKYEHTCAPCHGRGAGDDGRVMLPGTAALAIKYRGELPPALEDRQGLTADTIRAFVRNGSFSMPPFRPTELTDREIDDIAAYLAVSSSAAAAGSQR